MSSKKKAGTPASLLPVTPAEQAPAGLRATPVIVAEQARADLRVTPVIVAERALADLRATPVIVSGAGAGRPPGYTE